MNLQSQLPEHITKNEAAHILDISPYEVINLVISKTLKCSSFKKIPLAQVAQYLGTKNNWNQDYLELYILQKLFPCTNI